MLAAAPLFPLEAELGIHLIASDRLDAAMEHFPVSQRTWVR